MTPFVIRVFFELIYKKTTKRTTKIQSDLKILIVVIGVFFVAGG